jgi:hypothetical protein
VPIQARQRRPAPGPRTGAFNPGADQTGCNVYCGFDPQGNTIQRITPGYGLNGGVSTPDNLGVLNTTIYL